jgi:hypothetical protein
LRDGEAGSKRALYGPIDNFAAPLVRGCVLLGNLAKLPQKNASMIANGDITARLQKMSHFYQSMGQTMETRQRSAS